MFLRKSKKRSWNEGDERRVVEEEVRERGGIEFVGRCGSFYCILYVMISR